MMTPHIKTILYATDLSESAKYAFGYAMDLAQKYDATVTILYVMENLNHTTEIEIREMLGKEKWEELRQQKHEFLVKKIRKRVETFCTDEISGDDSCLLLGEKILIEKGNPQEVILETAGKTGADLIVVGTHGFNLLKDALMGGTARNVVRKSKVPVLVVRLPGK